MISMQIHLVTPLSSVVPVVPVVVPLAVDFSDAVHRDLVVRRPTADIKGL